LAFVLDALPDNAKHIDDLLRAAAESDAQVHAQATGALYAGDPDPYRHPSEEEDATG
jgi:ribosome-binding factor A